jgi:hypothetical protein
MKKDTKRTWDLFQLQEHNEKHEKNDEPLLSVDMVECFTTKKGIPTTWGEAVDLRIGKQNAAFRNAYPNGSFDLPKNNN